MAVDGDCHRALPCLQYHKRWIIFFKSEKARVIWGLSDSAIKAEFAWNVFVADDLDPAEFNQSLRHASGGAVKYLSISLRSSPATGRLWAVSTRRVLSILE